MYVNTQTKLFAARFHTGKSVVLSDACVPTRFKLAVSINPRARQRDEKFPRTATFKPRQLANELLFSTRSKATIRSILLDTLSKRILRIAPFIPSFLKSLRCTVAIGEKKMEIRIRRDLYLYTFRNYTFEHDQEQPLRIILFEVKTGKASR